MSEPLDMTLKSNVKIKIISDRTGTGIKQQISNPKQKRTILKLTEKIEIIKYKDYGFKYFYPIYNLNSVTYAA